SRSRAISRATSSNEAAPGRGSSKGLPHLVALWLRRAPFVKRKGTQRAARLAAVAEQADAAKVAGLCYVSDRRPGIARERAGKGFRYIDPCGEPIHDPETLERIRSLAIPPAWADVWICPIAEGHIQATGRDARGRKQYRYHPRWRQERDGNKYARMIAFARALPAIRRRVAADLRLPGLPRAKVLATVVRLLETTFIR